MRTISGNISFALGRVLFSISLMRPSFEFSVIRGVPLVSLSAYMSLRV